MAAAAVIGGCALRAEADDLKIRSPVIEAGEVEFENNFVLGRGKTTVHELEYGLTDWFKPGIELELAADPGQGLHYDATALEGFFQLTPQGKYWADLGIFVEYEQTERIRIETEHPLDVYADGEFVCQTPVEFSVARDVLKVIVPG